MAHNTRVTADADDAIDEASADIGIACKDGRALHVFVDHAIGSRERPMSDADLERKFHGLVDPVLGAARAAGLIAQCTTLSGCGDLRGFTALARG